MYIKKWDCLIVIGFVYYRRKNKIFQFKKNNTSYFLHFVLNSTNKSKRQIEIVKNFQQSRKILNLLNIRVHLLITTMEKK